MTSEGPLFDERASIDDSEERSSAAKAGSDFVVLTARLKVVPFPFVARAKLSGRRDEVSYPGHLKLDVGAERGDEDGAAVAVVAGIVDVLHAGREVNAAPDVGGVVGLQNIFAAVVQVSVAE